ncbi:hypothetical protein NMY22_g4436 [Coprinellus aureogranulatus]|nr:hypothetical protein NMY22_g4436 [Coprinellus aureogranulatus]
MRCRLRVSADDTRIMAAVGRTFGQPAPVVLRVSAYGVEAWSMCPDTGRVEMDRPWMEISNSQGRMANVWEWGWSFSILNSISVDGFDNPEQGAAFWKCLAENAKALRSLVLTAHCVSHAAIGYLMEWLRGKDRIPIVGSQQSLAWPLLGRLALPLPAEYNYRYKKTRDDDAGPPMHHQVEFALDLVDALKAREVAGSEFGIQRLKCLSIRTPFDIPLDEDISRALSSVADDVVVENS